MIQFTQQRRVFVRLFRFYAATAAQSCTKKPCLKPSGRQPSAQCGESTHTNAGTCGSLSLSLFIYACVSVRVRVCVRVFMCECVCVNVCMSVYTCTYNYSSYNHDMGYAAFYLAGWTTSCLCLLCDQVPDVRMTMMC